MTEMSPCGTCASIKPEVTGRDDPESALDLAAKQGCAPFAVDLRITDDDGRALPWDGTTVGRLKVAGPGVISGYFRSDNPETLDGEGFLDTGDVATVDAYGYVDIKDRSKDLIKSGGEWIRPLLLKVFCSGTPTSPRSP